MLVLGWAWLAARKLNILSKQTAIYYDDYGGVRNGLKLRVTKGWTEPGASRRKIFWLQAAVCPLFPSYPFHPALHGAKECGSVFAANFKGFALFFFFLLLLLVTWFFGCTLRDERSSPFHLFFSPAQKFSLATFYTFQLLGRNLGLLPVFILTFFSLVFHPLPSGSPGLLASKMFLGFWCIYFNLVVSVAQQ